MIRKTFNLLIAFCLLHLSLHTPLTLATDLFELNAQIMSEGTGSATIQGEKIPETTLTYEIKNGLAIFEGDIVLGKIPEISANRTDGAIITGTQYRWPNNTVPYQLKSNVSSATATIVANAVAYIESKTNIKFVKRTSANAGQYPDYVKVQSDDSACWSYVGRNAGEQELNVVEDCGFGATVHEFCHALGMWHEQSREDRNSYVTINWANIQSGKKHNFNQQISDGDDIFTYDFGSLMHYGRYDFAINNSIPTIETIPAGIPIGQRNGLSATDVKTLNAMYGSVAPPPPPPTTAATTLPSVYKLLMGDCPEITNGDFESGGASWLESSSNGYTLITNWIKASHSGTYHVWLAGDDNETSIIQRLIAVPSSCPYLSFYHEITSAENTCTWDYGYVKINGTTVKTTPLCIPNQTGGWVKTTVDLSGYANQTVLLQIQATTDSSNISDWFIDDVSFQQSP